MGATLIAAPAIVHARNIMPVRNRLAFPSYKWGPLFPRPPVTGDLYLFQDAMWVFDGHKFIEMPWRLTHSFKTPTQVIPTEWWPKLEDRTGTHENRTRRRSGHA